MRQHATILFVLMHLTVSGQMLQNTHVNVFDGRPEFSAEFMRQNNVKTIAGSFSSKAELDVIKETNEFTYLKFNRYGELTFECKTFLGDTLFVLYVWDERSNLIIKRTADRNGFQSYHYRYDYKNRLVYSEFRSCVNTDADRYTFIPSEETKISYEKYEYVDLDEKTYKKLYLNNSGIAYKEEFFYFNEAGKLIEQTGYQKSGSGKTTTLWRYNDAGQLVEKKYETSVMGSYKDRYEYEYDAWGNIFSMKYFENDNYKTEYQYVYDDQNRFLKAIIMRDVLTQVMTIIKYNTYSFY